MSAAQVIDWTITSLFYGSRGVRGVIIKNCLKEFKIEKHEICIKILILLYKNRKCFSLAAVPRSNGMNCLLELRIQVKKVTGAVLLFSFSWDLDSCWSGMWCISLDSYLCCRSFAAKTQEASWREKWVNTNKPSIIFRFLWFWNQRILKILNSVKLLKVPKYALTCVLHISQTDNCWRREFVRTIVVSR